MVIGFLHNELPNRVENSPQGQGFITFKAHFHIRLAQPVPPPALPNFASIRGPMCLKLERA
jgi:hypothetical protein